MATSASQHALRARPLVLIADDEASVRRTIRAILHSLPIDSIEAADGVGTIHCVQDHQPDLLILDYAFPDCDGLTLLHRLHDDPAFAKTKVIFISGYADLKMFHDLTAAHLVDGVAAKPFDAEKLAWQVRMLLRIRPAPQPEVDHARQP